MDVSEADLTEHFRILTDGALLERLQAGTLTPFAREIAEREARARGLEIPTAQPEADAAAESDESYDTDDIDLVTIAKFENPLTANVLRACLDSHGIFAFIEGEHLGVANRLMSIRGGTRLQVRSDQVAEAREVMAAFERGDFALDEDEEDPQ